MPSNLKVVFMGTPDFAVESLKVLIANGVNVVGIITAPDKPAGRGKKILPSPVKQYAMQLSNPPIVLQPTNLKNSDFLAQLKSLNADLQVVVAFRMLPESVWAMPAKGTINLHASLLPDYRGAAPINWAIINGEAETGVTTFFIEKDIDTGKIIFSNKVPILPEMNAGDLHDQLMEEGALLLLKTVKAIGAGSYPETPQDNLSNNKKLNAAPKIFKEDCRIKWDQPCIKSHNLIRGLSPYPTAWSEIHGNDKTLITKIYSSQYELQPHKLAWGTIISDGRKNLKVAVPDGYIIIRTLQVAGKKRMPVEDFLNGFSDDIHTYRFV